jgi:hypothetical protein
MFLFIYEPILKESVKGKLKLKYLQEQYEAIT